jgi:hypothetical protein
MTDLQSRVAYANPVDENDLAPSVQAFWRQLDAPSSRQHPGGRLLRRTADIGPRRLSRVHRPLMLGSASSLLAAAATLAVVLLPAGGSPSAAQAFPILRTATVDLHTRLVAPQGLFLGSALASAHAFSEPYGTGYVVDTRDGGTICMLIPSPSSAPTGSAIPLLACASTRSLEQQGALFTIHENAGSPDAFVALVPRGGRLTVTANGTTSAVPVQNGIATGVVRRTETLSLRVARIIATEEVAPDSPTSGFVHARLALPLHAASQG